MGNISLIDMEDKVIVDTEEYVTLRKESEELSSILNLIFEDSGLLETPDNRLFLSSSTNLMDYLKIIESHRGRRKGTMIEYYQELLNECIDIQEHQQQVKLFKKLGGELKKELSILKPIDSPKENL